MGGPDALFRSRGPPNLFLAARRLTGPRSSPGSGKGSGLGDLLFLDQATRRQYDRANEHPAQKEKLRAGAQILEHGPI